MNKVNKIFPSSFSATPKGCDLIFYGGTTVSTEHMGCMIDAQLKCC